MEEKKYNHIIIMSGLIGIIARIINIGWFFFFFITIGLIYIVLFETANKEFIKNFNKYDKAKPLFYISCITFALTCIVFPDGGDAETGYAVFRLIKNNAIIDLLYIIGVVLLIINFITVLIGLSLKKRNKGEIKK